MSKKSKPTAHAVKLENENKASLENVMKHVAGTGLTSHKGARGQSVIHPANYYAPTPRQSDAGLGQEFAKIGRRRVWKKPLGLNERDR